MSLTSALTLSHPAAPEQKAETSFLSVFFQPVEDCKADFEKCEFSGFQQIAKGQQKKKRSHGLSELRRESGVIQTWTGQ